MEETRPNRVRLSWIAVASVLLVPPSPLAAKNAPPGQEAVIEEFRSQLKAARSPQEKVSIIESASLAHAKDPQWVPPLAACLNPIPGDLFLLVPTAAAEGLSRFQGSPAAARALMAALQAAKKVPYLYQRVYMALGKVGHPLALSVFDEGLHGLDPSQASGAIAAIALMPRGISLEKLFDEYEQMEGKKKKANDAQKRVYDRCQPEIVSAVKSISGSPFPTFPELKLWWKKHGPEVKRESEENPAAGIPAGAPSPKAPLIVEFLFSEGSGPSAANSGASGILYPAGAVTAKKPSWTTTSAPNGGPSALEWDRTPGPSAVDVGGNPAGFEQLRNLRSFTLCGWFMCTDAKEVPGSKECGAGNRILSWINPNKMDGVDLVVRNDGRLQLGVNEWADASTVKTAPGIFHVYDVKEKDAGAEQFRTWCFFAVTYDSSLPQGQAKIYTGWRNGDVKLAVTADYPKGVVGPYVDSQLSIGNVTPDVRSQAPGRSFRGILDEIRIFGSLQDGAGALPLDILVRLQNRGPSP